MTDDIGSWARDAWLHARNTDVRPDPPDCKCRECAIDQARGERP